MSSIQHSVVFSLVCCGLCIAQPPDPPEVAALPAWPKDGKIPPQLEKRHIFHDLATDEIVVSYPSSEREGQRTTFRFWLANRVDPIVRVETSDAKDGLYSYRYTLTNGPRAHSPIQMWSVVGPHADPRISVSHPQWFSSGGKSTLAPPAAPQALVPKAPKGSHLAWGSGGMREVASIPPGGTVGDFQVVSGYRPGLTTAYAAGEEFIRVPADFTEEIGEELLPLEQIWVMRRPVLTIGPRFPPDMSLAEVASHFHDELKALVEARVLDPGSAYLQNLIGALENSAGREPKVTVQPNLGFEAQVAQAIHIALHTE